MKRRASLSWLPGLVLAMATAVAHADSEPVIALPGNPQVPVIINGVDATYGIVIGDWGLAAPGRIAPIVIPAGPPMAWPSRRNSYFPYTGRRPPYGRQEVIPPPNRYLPPPAPSYHRSWSTESDLAPATQYPPYEPPSVTIEPRERRFRPSSAGAARRMRPSQGRSLVPMRPSPGARRAKE